MARLIRLLPILIPLVTRVLRDPRVRARLGLKPTTPEQGSGSKRSKR